MPSILGQIDFHDSTIWAVLIGWIMSVTLHELAHGVVAFWGGDYTIRERGGLTLNPFQYVDPLMSIILPVIFLLMGGMPLPGGATYVRRDLLRNRGWEVAVSLAGPAMNLILFGLLAIPLMSDAAFDFQKPLAEWSNAQRFVSAMCFLQVMSVILNLIPIPPLDGFNALSPFLPYEVRMKVGTPPISHLLFFGYFMLWQAPGFQVMVVRGMHNMMGDQLFYKSVLGYQSIFAQ